MIEINTPKLFLDKYLITVKELIPSYDYSCPHSCMYMGEFWKGHCNMKDKYSRVGININISDGVGNCVAVLVNVKNIGTENVWTVSDEDIKLVDSDGYTYPGIVMCRNMKSFRTVEEGYKISPKTQADFLQLFPCMPEGVNVSKLLVEDRMGILEFNLSEEGTAMDNIETTSNIEANHDEKEEQIVSSEPMTFSTTYQLDAIIHNLKTKIFARTHNVLQKNEKIKLENQIDNMLFECHLMIDENTYLKEEEYKTLLADIEKEYKQSILLSQKNETAHISIEKKIEDLLQLSPEDFELYVGDLLKALGYNDVEVTPYVNDQGIDIIAYKESLKYGIQCKRYKGTVGSPDIQKFIGSLDHIKADKGLFITTGMFSFEAEKMASEHPIELINRVSLSQMVLEALKQ